MFSQRPCLRDFRKTPRRRHVVLTAEDNHRLACAQSEVKLLFPVAAGRNAVLGIEVQKDRPMALFDELRQPENEQAVNANGYKLALVQLGNADQDVGALIGLSEFWSQSLLTRTGLPALLLVEFANRSAAAFRIEPGLTAEKVVAWVDRHRPPESLSP